MIRFSKYFKFFLLILITFFLIPNIVLAEINAIYNNEWIVNQENSFKVEASSSGSITSIGVDFGNGNTPYYDGCNNKTNCNYTFYNSYDASVLGPRNIHVIIVRDVSVIETNDFSVNIKAEGPIITHLLYSPDSVKVGDDVKIRATAQTDYIPLNILYVFPGDGNNLSCFCKGDINPCSNQGEMNCSNLFIYKYSAPGSYTISSNVVDNFLNVSEEKTHDKKIIITGSVSGNGPGLIQITNPLSATDFKDFIDKLVRFLFTICLIVVPILLVVAGIMFVTSQGDPEKARKAKKMILFTLIGFAIISLARIFVSFIEQIFGK